MRAKPEMKPWEYVDKTEKSSVGAALTGLLYVFPINILYHLDALFLPCFLFCFCAFFVYIGRNALGILKFYYAKSCIY